MYHIMAAKEQKSKSLVIRTTKERVMFYIAEPNAIVYSILAYSL